MTPDLGTPTLFPLPGASHVLRDPIVTLGEHIGAVESADGPAVIPCDDGALRAPPASAFPLQFRFRVPERSAHTGPGRCPERKWSRRVLKDLSSCTYSRAHVPPHRRGMSQSGVHDTADELMVGRWISTRGGTVWAVESVR